MVYQDYKNWIKTKVLAVDNTLEVSMLPSLAFDKERFVLLLLDNVSRVPATNQSVRVSVTFVVEVVYNLTQESGEFVKESELQQLMENLEKEFSKTENRSPGVVQGDYLRNIRSAITWEDLGGLRRVGKLWLTFEYLDNGL